MQLSKIKKSKHVESTTIAAILTRKKRQCVGDAYVVESAGTVLYAGATGTKCATSRIIDHVGKQWHLSALGKLFRAMPVQALRWRVHLFSTLPGVSAFEAEQELIDTLHPALNVKNNSRYATLPEGMRNRIKKHEQAVKIAARVPLVEHRALAA